MHTRAHERDRQQRGTFVGRESVLRLLGDALEHARSGDGLFVLLQGEPGIGKTRTATEVMEAARQRGIPAVVGRCHEEAGAPAYWPWRQVLRELVSGSRAEELARIAAPALQTAVRIAPEIGRVAHPSPLHGVDGATARFRLFDDVTTLLAAAAAGSSLLVVLDDLQWGDEASLRLLQFLARDPRARCLVVVGTCRDPLPDIDEARASALADVRREAEVVDLRGLDEDAVGHLLAAAGGQPPSAEVISALHRRTEGNPLFVTEIVRLLAAEGRLGQVCADDVASARLPAGVRHVIRERLAALAPSTRVLLTWAAAIGAEFDAAVVERLAGEVALADGPALRIALAEAVRAQLLDPAGVATDDYRFTHVLVREALYDEVPERERAALHGRIAGALEALSGEGGPPCEALALHHARAGSGEAAITWAMRAGQRALAAWAYDDAAGHFRRALAMLDRVPVRDVDAWRCELTLAFGSALARAGRSREARGTLVRAAGQARAAGSPVQMARAALAYPSTAGVMSTELFDAELTGLLDRALAALGAGDEALRARLMARLSGAPGRAALAPQAVDLARRAGDPATLAFTLRRLHWMLRDADAAERIAIADEVVRLAERIGDRELELEGRTERLRDLLELGDRTAIDLAAARHRQLCEELRQPAFRWIALVSSAMLAFLDGDFAEGERRAGEALAVGQQAEPDHAMQAFAGQIGTIRREQGRLDEVEPSLTAIAAAEPDVMMWRCTLAFVHAELGHRAESRALLDDLRRQGFDRLPRDGFWLSAMAQVSEAIAAVADAESAAAVYALLLPYADRHLIAAGAISFGAAARFLGMLAAVLERWDEARAHFERALVLNERLRALPWVAHTQVELARLLSSAPERDPARARALLSQAETTARAHGMDRLLARIAAVSGPEVSTAIEPVEGATMRREGDYWTIVFAGGTTRLRHVKGLRYLAALLEEPGRELHVFDLLALTEGVAATTTAPEGLRVARGDDGGGLVADTRARAAYREMLRDLEGEVSDAEAAQDLGRAERARERLETLHVELAVTYGLGGRLRRAAGSPLERARKAVYNRVHGALARLDREHPELARHLTKAIRTGTTCVYLPVRPLRWDVAG